MKDMIQVLNLLRKLGYSKDEIRFRPTSRITAVRVAGEIAYNVSALAAVAIVRYHQQAVSAIAPMLLLGVVAIIL